jgi:pyridoxine/pyridoxamine 5'-phosphate oxidase
MCVAITVDRMGKAHARTVQTSELSDEWTLRFMTDRRTRKVEDIEQTGQLVLSFQHAPDNAYVTLTGRATLIRDSAVKQASGGRKVSNGIRAARPTRMLCWWSFSPSASRCGARATA